MSKAKGEVATLGAKDNRKDMNKDFWNGEIKEDDMGQEAVPGADP